MGNVGASLRDAAEEWDDFLEDTGEIGHEDGGGDHEDVIVN